MRLGSRTRLTLRETNLRVLDLQLRRAANPRWRELAFLRACIGAPTDRHLRRAARALLGQLGFASSRCTAWRLAWTWWSEGATHWLHSYQAERLTPEWCAAHVAGAVNVPSDGAVLLSVHHFNQRLAWVRLSQTVERLGLISFFSGGASVPATAAHVDQSTARRQLNLLYRRTFGDRVFHPPIAGLGAVRLLTDGGHVIVAPDGSLGPERGEVFGRRVPLAHGALWLARRSGRPIVPFAILPCEGRWRLWCGDPVAPDDGALERAVEDCIRHSPTNWMLMREWFDASIARTS